MMTDPESSPPDEHPAAKTPQDKLRAEILTSALSDWVPLAEVENVISYFHLAETAAARQELTLRTIRSLLEEGLIEVGDLPSQGGKLAAWDVSVDAAMSRMHERYVVHYDSPATWDFSIWFGLSDAGEHVAKAMEATPKGG